MQRQKKAFLGVTNQFNWHCVGRCLHRILWCCWWRDFLAILSVIMDEKFAVINATKNAIAFVGNLVATIIFIFKSHIAWLYVIPLGFGLLIGGYTGPIIVRHANVHLLRASLPLQHLDWRGICL